MIYDEICSGRMGAVEVLRLVWSPVAAEFLGKRLVDRFEPERREARRTIMAIGRCGLDALDVAIRDGDSEGCKIALAVLEALIPKGHGEARVSTPTWLLALSSHSDPDVRLLACKVLGEIGDDGAREALVQALGDRERHVVSAAAEALGKVGGACACQPLLRLASFPEDSVRKAVRLALEQLDPNWRRTESGREALLKDSSAGTWDQRLEAASELAKLGDVRAARPLLEICKTDDRPGSGPALHALGLLIEAAAPLVAGEDLRLAASLRNLFDFKAQCGTYVYGDVLDPGHVRQLARQELLRRGEPESV
jgi:hypothetical protein